MCLDKDGNTLWHFCPKCRREWTNRHFTQCGYPKEYTCGECSGPTPPFPVKDSALVFKEDREKRNAG